MIDINEILTMIPHHYPILLVDRVIEFQPDDYMVTLKNVTFNEPHFQGHFPQSPIMPGVLIIEAIAQSAALFAVKTLGANAKGKLVYFMSIDNAKFRKPVIPGDSLKITVKKLHNRSNVWKFFGVVEVENKIVTEAKVTAMILDK